VEAVSRTMTVEEIVEVVLRDRAFYGRQGGLTLSGGEPLQHPEACLQLLAACRAQGLTTAVETAGAFDGAVLEQNEAASKGKTADLQALVSKGQTWMVEKEPRPE
jgi:pyruvate-formate lyase-activating enzyme